MPALPNSKPAAGMSATSGPMFEEPNFGEEKPVDHAALVAQAQQPVVAPTATASSAAPTGTAPATAAPVLKENKAEQ
jgi:hypothetical protein